MPTVTVYGLVATCPRALSPGEIDRVVSSLGRTMFPTALIVIDEAADRGSLVSAHRETFRYLQISDGERHFSLCRFRQFTDGLEFAFNLSDSNQTAEAIDRYLTSAMPIEVVRREFL